MNKKSFLTRLNRKQLPMQSLARSKKIFKAPFNDAICKKILRQLPSQYFFTNEQVPLNQNDH